MAASFLRIFSVFFLTSYLNLPATGNLEDSNFEDALVWQITKKGSLDTSFLLGTIHLPLKKVFATVDTCRELIKKCDGAYFEMVVTQESMGEQAFFFLAQNEKELPVNILDSSGYMKLKEIAANALGPSASIIDRLKPIGVYSVLTMATLPSDTTNSMDVLYQDYAKSLGIKVGGIETIDEQMAVMDSLQKYGGKELLVSLVSDFDSLEIKGQELITAYCNHDLKAILNLTNEEFSTSFDKQIKRELLTKRNEIMASRIAALAEKDNYFFAIGAAHLVGKDGVLNLLVKEGFELNPVK